MSPEELVISFGSKSLAGIPTADLIALRDAMRDLALDPYKFINGLSERLDQVEKEIVFRVTQAVDAGRAPNGFSAAPPFPAPVPPNYIAPAQIPCPINNGPHSWDDFGECAYCGVQRVTCPA
jgi:hypothetical protein